MARSGKGSAFEREFCRLLSRWWTGGSRDDCFWRTSNSGGRATVRGRKGQGTAGQYGDIAATDDCGRPLTVFFAFELKRGYPRAVLHDLLDKPAKAARQTYEDWLEQARDSAKLACSRYWLIVHKRDRREPLCLFPKALVDDVWNVQKFSEFDPIATFDLFVRTVGPLQVAAMRLDDFLKNLTPDDVRKLLKRGSR